MFSYRTSPHTRQFAKMLLALSWAVILLLLVNGHIPITRAAGPWYVAPPPLGNDVNDCATLTTPCATINAAVAKASTGDTINIATGTYIENITVTMPLIFSGAGANNTIVDGNFAGRVFTILSGTVSIANLTVQHGHTSGDGGGIYAADRLTVTNVTVMSNTAGGNGGGVKVDRALMLNSSRFMNNTAYQGGGIYLSGNNLAYGYLYNILLAGNTATSAQGNALFDHSQGILLDSATIASPTLGNGSAIFDWHYSGTASSVRNTLIASYTIGYEQTNNEPNKIIESDTLFSGVITPYAGTRIESWGHSFTGTAGLADPIGGDYHLTASSDAINRVRGYWACPETDLEGNPRPTGCGCDIGAYEYQAAPACMLTIGISGTGVVTPAVGTYPYAYGVEAIVTASTSAPWSFGGWSGDVGSAAYSTGISMDGDKTITATFGLPACYATPDNGLTVESSPNATAVQRAVDQAPNNGTVKVAGTCAGVQKAYLNYARTLDLWKPLTLLGGYTVTNWLTAHPLTQPTVLDALHAGPVIQIDEVYATLADLTIQNGYASSDGGGVYADSSLTLTNVNVMSNTATHSGGGVWAGGTLMITGGLFQNNRSITQVGGGLRSFHATSITGGIFKDNQAPNGVGGGLETERVLTLNGTRFTNNTAKEGGAVYLTGSDGLPSYLTNVILDGNTATTARGNALFAYAGSVTLYHGTIVSPTLGNGSAIHGFGNYWFVYSTLIANYTIGYNQVSGNPGWLYEYRTLFSDVTTPYIGTNIDIDSHSFNGAPGFVDPIGGDYHLTASSAAINRGLEMMRPITADFDGNPRPVGCGYDIGAYEYQTALDCMLTIGIIGTGVVTPSVGTHSYAYGTIVPITASTSAPWSFAGWSGSVTSTVHVAAVYMLSDNSVVATFAAYQVYLPLVLK